MVLFDNRVMHEIFVLIITKLLIAKFSFPPSAHLHKKVRLTVSYQRVCSKPNYWKLLCGTVKQANLTPGFFSRGKCYVM